MSIWVYGIYIFVPLIVANVLHMLVVRQRLLSCWALPLSRGLFGANKTWRGLLLLPLLNGLLFVALNFLLAYFKLPDSFAYGFWLGLAYILFELPNSFLKRRLGIPPGARSERFPLFFAVLDKTDSALGVLLLSKFLFRLSWMEILLLFLAGISIHAFFSYLLVVLGVKERF